MGQIKKEDRVLAYLIVGRTDIYPNGDCSVAQKILSYLLTAASISCWFTLVWNKNQWNANALN